MAEIQYSASESDDFPRKEEPETNQRPASTSNQAQVITIALVCVTNFLYGAGLSIYGPIFPSQAEEKETGMGIYGLMLSSSYLASLLFFPIAHILMSSVSLKLFHIISLFTVAICKILFGTVSLIPIGAWFTSLSFAIQVIDGMGVTALMTSSYSLLSSQFKEKAYEMIATSLLFLLLGVIIGPIAGYSLYKVAGFGISFYGIGVLMFINTICVIATLREPEHKILPPNISWMKYFRLLIYFFLVFTSFIYTGFLWVTLEPHLRQFNLNFIFIGMMFAIPAFVYGLAIPGWEWLIHRGHFNGLLLSVVCSLIVIASLILLGPAPFSGIEITVGYVVGALTLKGLGISGKLSGYLSAVQRDIETRSHVYDNLSLLIVPSICTQGAFLGIFLGSAMAGFATKSIGFPNATYILYGVEGLTASVAFVLAFSRNYRAKHVQQSEETENLLGS